MIQPKHNLINLIQSCDRCNRLVCRADKQTNKQTGYSTWVSVTLPYETIVVIDGMVVDVVIGGG
jgi:hypothetical protein